MFLFFINSMTRDCCGEVKRADELKSKDLGSGPKLDLG